MVTETPISQDDIDGLAAALDGLALPSGQRALLSSIISIAAGAVTGAAPDPVPPFREQFNTAFTPEGGTSLLVGRLPSDIGRVTPTNIGRTHPHPTGPTGGTSPSGDTVPHA